MLNIELSFKYIGNKLKIKVTNQSDRSIEKWYINLWCFRGLLVNPQKPKGVGEFELCEGVKLKPNEDPLSPKASDDLEVEVTLPADSDFFVGWEIYENGEKLHEQKVLTRDQLYRRFGN